MVMAYATADKTGRDHLLRKAMLAEGGTKVVSQQATLALRAPQPLSHARAVSPNKETIDDFFCQTWSHLWEVESYS